VSNVFTTRPKINSVRAFVIFFVLSALLAIGWKADNAPEAAADPQTDITSVLQMLQGTDWQKLLRSAATPVDQQTAPVEVAPTAEALNVATQEAVQVAGGTGWGQPGPNIIQDGKTYVKAPNPASIVPGGPGALGPDSFAVSVQKGADQMEANALAHPQGVYELSGHSQGECVAQNAANQMGPNTRAHVTGSGTPCNPGTGFVSVMPSNLLFTQTGEAKPVDPEDTAEFWNRSGDGWGATPDVRNPLAVLAAIISTVEPGEDGTHYSPQGYSNFRDDLVYKTNSKGELDPEGNITQHVMFSENGLVILAKKINPNMPESQKQQLRDLAPQALPGVNSMPVTPRELVENPSLENIAAFFGPNTPQSATPQAQTIPAVGNLGGGDLMGTVTQALGSVLPGLTGTNPTESTSVDPTNLVSNVVSGLTNNAIGEAPATEAQAPTMAAPTQDYVNQGIAQVEEWANTQSPEIGNVVSTVANVVDTFTGASQPTYTAPVSSMNNAPAQAAAPAMDLGAVAAQAGIPADLTNAVTGLFAGLPH
jgi:hypothetical protein